MERPLFSLAEMSKGNANCLRQAARWATALRADELCQRSGRNTNDRRGGPALADRDALPCTKIGGLTRLATPPVGWPDGFNAVRCDLSPASTGNSPAEDAEVINNLLAIPSFMQDVPEAVRQRARSTDPTVRRRVSLKELCTMPEDQAAATVTAR
jgi:hypothetical protein